MVVEVVKRSTENECLKLNYIGRYIIQSDAFMWRLLKCLCLYNFVVSSLYIVYIYIPISVLVHANCFIMTE